MVALPSTSCRKCGTVLPTGATGGFCTRCLFTAVALPLVGSAMAQSFGNYELIGLIAQGGMGMVYKARDRQANRIVALKMVQSGLFAGETERKRFRVEAEAVASLDHPNIVPVYEVGEENGHPFFTMKLVEGPSLVPHLASQDGRAAARVIAKVARAIQHAHERGILHRDLKPGNILLDDKGEVFVTDFGLARQMKGGTELTVTGVVMGTPSYMSPEQAAGKNREVTTATDVYSLGAVLYHLLTGHAPFAGETQQETIRQVLEQEPKSPSSLKLGIDRNLETICLKCLEKAPAQRYASAALLAEDLDRWLRHEIILARRATTVERAAKWVRRRPLVAALTASIAVAVMAGVIGIFFQWREAERALHATAALLTQAELDKADNLLKQGNPGGGLAYYAHILRREPDNLIAASRIMSYLRRHPVILPEVLLPGRDQRVIESALSLDQSTVVMAVDEEKSNIQIGNLLPGRSTLPALTHPFKLLMMARGPGGPPPFLNQGGLEMPDFRPISVNFNSDGTRIVTASISGNVRVWDARTGQPVTPFLEHDWPVIQAQLSPDGESLTTLCRDGVVRVWEVATAKVVREFDVWPIALINRFSGDATRLLLGDFYEIHLLDVRTGQYSLPLKHSDRIQSACWNQDDTAILAAAKNTAYVWTGLEKVPVAKKFLHPAAVTLLALSPDGQTLATGCADRQVRLWNMQTGELAAPPLILSEAVTAISFSHDGRRAVLLTQSGEIRLVDTASGAWLCEPFQESDTPLSVYYTLDDRGVIILCRDGAVRRCTLANPPSPIKSLAVTGKINTASFSPDGTLILTASEDGVAHLVDTQTGLPLPVFFPHGAPIMAAAFSLDGGRVVTAGTDDVVKIWDARTGQALAKPMRQSSSILSVQFTANGATVTVLTRSGLGQIWNAHTGAPASEPLDFNYLADAVLSPDGKTVLASLGPARAATLLDLATGNRIGLVMKHGEFLESCRFSPDGQKVITASADNTARIWDARTAKPLSDPLRHEGAVHLAIFSPDGRQAVTVSQDRTARLWDTADGAALAHTLNHSAAVRAAEFSRDNTRLLTVADDFSVHLWDTRSGQELADPLDLARKITAAHFSPDGQTILIIGNDGTTQLWPVPVLPLPAPPWLADLAELIGGRRLDAKGLAQPAPGSELAKLRQILSTNSPGDIYAAQARALWVSRP